MCRNDSLSNIKEQYKKLGERSFQDVGKTRRQDQDAEKKSGPAIASLS